MSTSPTTKQAAASATPRGTYNPSRLAQVLVAPIVSEKGTMTAEKHNQVLFQVLRDATKPEIKAAVEAEFKVTVLDVRIVSVRSKQKRRGRRTMGTVPGWKKAIVSIAPGDKIELFEAV